MFKASCVRCHGAERPKAQLRLDTLEGVLKGTKQGPVVTAGDSANSLLVKAISQPRSGNRHAAQTARLACSGRSAGNQCARVDATRRRAGRQ